MEEQDKQTHPATSDEVALELMKFIASSTAYGKGMQQVGFAGKGTRTPEASAEMVAALLLELHARQQTMLIVVTHSATLAARFPLRYELRHANLHPAGA